MLLDSTYSLCSTSVNFLFTLIFKQTIYLQFDCQFGYANSFAVQQITLTRLLLVWLSFNGKQFGREGDIFPVLSCRGLFFSAVLVCQ